jgi:hypothetical protein
MPYSLRNQFQFAKEPQPFAAEALEKSTGRKPKALRLYEFVNLLFRLASSRLNAL